MGWSKPIADGFSAFTKQVKDHPEVGSAATVAISALTFLPWQPGRIVGATTLLFTAYHLTDHLIADRRWGKECIVTECHAEERGWQDQARGALKVHLRFGLIGSLFGLFNALAARMPLPKALPKISAGELSLWFGLAGAACMTVGQVRAGQVDTNGYVEDYHPGRHRRRAEGGAAFMVVLLVTPLLIPLMRGLKAWRLS